MTSRWSLGVPGQQGDAEFLRQAFQAGFHFGQFLLGHCGQFGVAAFADQGAQVGLFRNQPAAAGVNGDQILQAGPFPVEFAQPV